MPHIARASAWPIVLTLTLGMVLGFLLGTAQPRPALAIGPDRSPDRSGESIIVSAPMRTEQNPSSKMQFTLDAVYYLNYSSARLFASFPIQQQTIGSKRFLSNWADRDLLADFHLSPTANAHFVATVGSTGGLSEGWSPLYVLEMSTGQVAVYHAVQDLRSMGAKIELVEIRTDPRLATALASR